MYLIAKLRGKFSVKTRIKTVKIEKNNLHSRCGRVTSGKSKINTENNNLIL